MGPTRVRLTCGVGRPHSGPPCPFLSRAGRVEFVLPVCEVHLPYTCFCAYMRFEDKICTKGELCRFESWGVQILFIQTSRALITLWKRKCYNSKYALIQRVMLPRLSPCPSPGVQPWSTGRDGKSRIRP